jgi:V/A-type H+-transporting ATPase subunit I
MFKIDVTFPAFFSTVGLYLLLAGLLIVFLFGGRREESFIGKMGQGLMEVYGISSLLGDVLSYARLFALGLSTGVIAGVFNKLALMLKEIGGVPGWIFFVILLIIGHLFNIAMNSLGSFIHTLRLQFVEFFGKFYTGGGEEFKPLKRELKYIMVEKENIQ